MNLEEFVIGVTKKIGEIHLQYFKKTITITQKTRYPSDIITNVDKLSEKVLIDWARRECFDGIILTEESGEIKIGENHELKLIVDPLDGSFNFSIGIPSFCVAMF